MKKVKKTPATSKVYNKIYDVIGAVIQGTKITRGYCMQHAVARKLREQHPEWEIHEEFPLETSQFKTNKHKVDIICIDNALKKVHIYSVKSEGISNTDPKINVGIPQMRDALSAAQAMWVGYDVSFSVLRTGGYSIPEWDAAGFPTFDTSTFIGENIFDVVDDEVKKLISHNTEKQIRLSGMKDVNQIVMVREIALKLIQDIVK